ncbi:unnamed protein product [Caenorhabditis sp. 36 PRJEB53466]|nr:unnamed protein product [Caenorhabditis sp. 36 PRJEB53466]
MMSSGPIEPSDVILNSSYPNPIVVPLDFVDKQSRPSRDELNIDESGLYMMSQALEKFMRRMIQEATKNGTLELNYDTIAEFIAQSEFRALKDFFPQRMEFGDIMEQIGRNAQTTSSATKQ